MKLADRLYPFIGSFYDRNLYRVAAFLWTIVPFYIVVGAVIIGNIPDLLTSSRLFATIHQEAYIVIDQLPAFNLEKGRIVSTQKQSTPLYNSDKKQVGSFNPNQAKELNPNLLLFQANPTELVFTLPPINYISTKPYDTLYSGPISHQQLKNIADQYLKIFSLGFPIFSLIFSLILFLIRGMIYAAIGKFLAKIHGLSLTFKTIFRITVIAMIPMQIIFVLVALLPIQIPFFFLIYLTGPLVFLYYGLSCLNPLPPIPPQNV